MNKYSIDGIFAEAILAMEWDIQYTDEFGRWWDRLSEPEQESVSFSVRLLKMFGPDLAFPHSSGVGGSRHRHMRELRTQHAGRPLRTLYAFDSTRTAILLLGGDKTGDKRWYPNNIRLADRLYDEHLIQLRRERPINGQ